MRNKRIVRRLALREARKTTVLTYFSIEDSLEIWFDYLDNN